MSLTPSTMLPLGTPAPYFALPSAHGGFVSLDDFPVTAPLLVMFICNHCPYVKHVRAMLAELGREYQAMGIGVVAINSNDVAAYPADDLGNMKKEAELAKYPFPYLLDESQSVAQSYDAACTPDFFLFDAQRLLVYRGQLDESRPGNAIPVTGESLRAAVSAVMAGELPSVEQKPSVGCNIKWKPGNEPA